MRVSTDAIYARVLGGLRVGFDRLIGAQEQVATGRRLLRPSDDATATSRVLTLQRELSDAERLRESSVFARTFVDSAASALEETSGLLAEVRVLVLQGMNGTLDSEARQALGQRVELLRQQLIGVANDKSADRFLFSGTATGAPPWAETSVGGYPRTAYRGNDDEQLIRIGSGAEVGINLPGSVLFDRREPRGPAFAGLTGLRAGSSASEGESWEWLEVEQTGLDLGDLASVGVSQSSGSPSTILQSAPLAIDAATSTVRLGQGTPVKIPGPTAAGADAVLLRDEFGAEVTLDFSLWSGLDYSGAVTGTGTISVAGGAPVALDFSDTDLRLENPATGMVLHLDTTAVRRSGQEVVQFDGAVNLFDVLGGIAADLANDAELPSTLLADRLELRLSELDRHADSVLVGLGVLGSRSGRLESTASRFDQVTLQVEALISESRDADVTQAILDLRQAESTLELAQSTGVRLIQRTLLDFVS
jgi:flagellar hook-associated protein 3